MYISSENCRFFEHILHLIKKFIIWLHLIFHLFDKKIHNFFQIYTKKIWKFCNSKETCDFISKNWMNFFSFICSCKMEVNRQWTILKLKSVVVECRPLFSRLSMEICYKGQSFFLMHNFLPFGYSWKTLAIFCKQNFHFFNSQNSQIIAIF